MAKNDIWVKSVADLPVESGRKYGEWDDNVDGLADSLSGGEPRRRSDPHDGFGISHTDALDEDFLREIGNPSNHYGK